MTPTMAERHKKYGLLSADRLRPLLHYDPLTGNFTWLVDRNHNGCKGTRAGAIKRRYIYIKIDGWFYSAGHLAFLYMTGEWAKGCVDHKNRIPTDDRWDNLRDATRSENNANRGSKRKAKSGFKGVIKQGRRWKAAIQVCHKRHHLGSFSTPDEAHAAYVEAARLYFGAFAECV